MTGLVRALLSWAKGIERLAFPGAELEGLRVAVFGLRSHVSRDTVRYLANKRASVSVVGQAREVELLRRDLELLHTQVNLAPLDVINRSEVGLMTDSLRARGRLPHVVVCCCSGGDCAIPVVVSVMQPSLVLHLAASGSVGSGLDRMGIAARTLAALLNDSGLFDPARVLSKVKLGRSLFDVSRRDTGGSGGGTRRRPGAAARPVLLSKSALRPAAPIRQAVRSRQTQSLHEGDQA